MKKSYSAKIKGFTMLETVVCLAVFSVTLAAAIPAFEEFSEKTDENKFKSQCKNILATAEVMANENYKLGTSKDKLINELNDEFEGYTIDVGFERGKVLWLEVARNENPRIMYYTDEDSFVESKPSGFDVKRSEKTVEWAVEPTPGPVPENPVHINPFEYPAGRIGQGTPAPYAEENEPVTEPAVTTVSEETVTLPETTTTVTTVTEAAEASSLITTEVTEATTTVTTRVTESTTTEKVTETMPVTTTHKTLDLKIMSDKDLPENLSIYKELKDDIVAVNVKNKDGSSYDFFKKYALEDFGYDWELLTGVAINFTDMGTQPGGQIILNDWTYLPMENFGNNSCEVRINQYDSNKIRKSPDSITYEGYNIPGTISDVTYYFMKEKPYVNDGGIEVFQGIDNCYYNTDLNRKARSVTIVFDEYTYNRNVRISYQVPTGNPYYPYETKTVSADMNRTNEKYITIPVDDLYDRFEITATPHDGGGNTISNVYVNY